MQQPKHPQPAANGVQPDRHPPRRRSPVGAKNAPIGAEIAALEARAMGLMKSAAVLQFEAMHCLAKAAELGKERDG